MRLYIIGKFLAAKTVVKKGEKNGKPWQITTIALDQDGEQQNALIQLPDELAKKVASWKDGQALGFSGSKTSEFGNSVTFDARVQLGEEAVKLIQSVK